MIKNLFKGCCMMFPPAPLHHEMYIPKPGPVSGSWRKLLCFASKTLQLWFNSFPEILLKTILKNQFEIVSSVAHT